MESRCLSARLLVLAIVVAAGICLSCERIPDSKVKKKDGKKTVLVEPVEEESTATRETDVSTSESRENTPDPGDDSNPDLSGAITGESHLATYEYWIATDEEAMSTGEESIDAKNNYAYIAVKCGMLGLKDGEFREIATLNPGERVQLLEKVRIKWRKREQEAFYVEDKYGERGYIHESNFCRQRLCVTSDRCGIVEMYSPVDVEYKRIPQIRIVLENLYEHEIEELHVHAVFKLEGEEIGMDSAQITSKSQGLAPMKTGESRKAFLRPAYYMEEDETLNKDRYIEVDLSCSVNFNPYFDCGSFRIDHAYY